jgi:hypothetical protein
MFLTVKEASDLTGKSATTIYRLCNKRRNSLYIKKEDNKFFIDKEFLLATYPQEEKRIIEIIENGSKETGEAVFLEIEPKHTETILLSENVENKIVPDIEVIPGAIMNDAENEYISALKALSFKVDDNVVINKSTVSINLSETNNLSFYKKKTFWESFIGLSVIVLSLILLLVLFYLNVN